MTQVLLVTGGKQKPEGSFLFLDSTEILESLTWSLSAPLPTGLNGVMAVSMNTNIYIFGRIIDSLDQIFFCIG